MGYTHYFEIKETFPDESWNKLTYAMNTLLKNLPEYSESAGGYYVDEPLVIDGPDYWSEKKDGWIKSRKFNGHDYLMFNGKTPKEYKDDLDLSCESFVLSKGKAEDSLFEFCKTERRPYGLLVCATLLVAKKLHGDGIKIKSDGGVSDWKSAYDWTVSVLGEESVENPKNFIRNEYGFYPSPTCE